MKAFSIQFIALFGFLVLFSCGSSGDNGEEPPQEQKNPPAKAIGTLPVNGEPCSDYEEVTGNDTEVLVNFKWNEAQQAQNYVLTIQEGATEVFSNSFTVLETKVQLERGKTFSWSLTSVNTDGETTGDTYSFTTPGIQIGNFAPYAAEITITFDEMNSEMSVSWVGQDEDGDQLVYDVTVNENDTVLFEALDHEQESIAPIVYNSGENYTVEVVSKDPSGSFSVSKMSIDAPN